LNHIKFFYLKNKLVNQISHIIIFVVKMFY